MPNLKDLKNRIGSVKSTQKITKAMKMVAASKLRRAQERAIAARPYAQKMESVLSALAASVNLDNAPALLAGRRDAQGKLVDSRHLIIIMTSDRGLCGGFNTSIIKAAKARIESLTNNGKKVQVILAGRKAWDQMKSNYAELITERGPVTEQKVVEYDDAERLANLAIGMFEDDKIDTCEIIYNKFVSPLVQTVTEQQIIPVDIPAQEEASNDNSAIYEYEPEEEEILKSLLPRNIGIQIFRGLLENAASEQGARMTAMDNATRNAGDMIGKLTLQYNRTRQAAITTELTEIISGAEAL